MPSLEATLPGIRFGLKAKTSRPSEIGKLEAEFFWLFRVLHQVGKPAYKLELPKKWRIHDVLHVPLLEQDTTQKGRVDENAKQLEFEVSNDE